MSPWKVILATMIIFGSGVLTGALLIRTLAPESASNVASAPLTNAPAVVLTRTNAGWAPWQAQRIRVIRQMIGQLDLSEEQKEHVSQIIKESQERNQKLWERITPQMREELRRVVEDIRQQLTPQQRRQFAEMLRAKRRRPDTNAPPDTLPATNAPATTAS